MGWSVERDGSSFFSGVCMTVLKHVILQSHDTVKVIYEIMAEVDIGNENICANIFLNDIIEYTIKSEEVLKKIPEFEEQVRKREQELEEKAKKLSEVLKELESMGYIVAKEGSIVREPVLWYERHCGY